MFKHKPARVKESESPFQSLALPEVESGSPQTATPFSSARVPDALASPPPQWPDTALAVWSGLSGVSGFLLMYLLISLTLNRASMDLLFAVLISMLGDRIYGMVTFWLYFVTALLLACSGIGCGHWTRSRARVQCLRIFALFGLWGGYLTFLLVGGGFFVLIGIWWSSASSW